MLIRDTFATKINEKIEPVVKVADRKPDVVYGELANLIVTSQWERYIHTVLDAYVDAIDRNDEQGIGTWISGFFGSGKSLLMKVLGLLIEGGDVRGQPVESLFLSRLPVLNREQSAQEIGSGHSLRSDIERFLTTMRRKLTATAVGGNLHSRLTSADDRLALVVFKLFCEQRGYTHSWPLAWAVEYQIDEQGAGDSFRAKAAELAAKDWDEIAHDPEYHLNSLYQAAALTLPTNFPDAGAVDRAVNLVGVNGIDARAVIDRFRRWCERRDAAGKRHKLWLQLDELGQWIAAGNANDRTNQVQALVEEAAENGGGRIWLSVTAHGDVQALQQNVQQEQYAKIIQRFAQQCKLSNEDISQVVEERVLRKTQEARNDLSRLFDQRSGEIADLGRVEGAQRVYPAPSKDNFALFYPYLPWTVTVVPDVVKGVAQGAQRDEALTGSNRTMIAVVQGALIEGQDLLSSPVGKLVALADLYPQLSSDVAVETKTDLSRIAGSVPDATAMTTRVAYGVFLLGQAQYIPTTLDNVTRAVVGDLQVNLAGLRRQVKNELERLVAAGFVKQVAEQYVFLNTQQRSFQDKVRARQEELLRQAYNLSRELQEQYKNETALRFETAAIGDREIAMRLELDGSVIRNTSGTYVTVKVFSPLQRVLEPQIADDAVLRQRSAQERSTILVRLAETTGFRQALALASATDAVSNEILARQATAGGEAEVARQARQIDLPDLRAQVRTLLGQAVRGSSIFFDGSTYQVAPGDNAGEAMRATLGQILPSIFPRFGEVTHRVANEQAAVRAALANNTANTDLRSLEVFRADSSLNEGHALISAVRGRLPLVDQDQEPMSAAELRREFEAPPYGWDGNAVKVALALLLRASACRLIESGQPIVDPASSQAEQALATESRFKTLRVQGIRSELDLAQLKRLRDTMRQVFGLASAPPLVAATLDGILAEQLTQMAQRVQSLERWGADSQCPLPANFAADSAVIQELLNTSGVARRLSVFADQAARLQAFAAALPQLEQFRREQATVYSSMRDFYNGMVNAGTGLQDVNTFVSDFRALSRARTITDPARWNELYRTYLAAKAALDQQVASWRQEIQDQLGGLHAELEEALAAAGVPSEARRDEAAEISTLYEPIRTQLAQDATTYGELAAMRTTLAGLNSAATLRIAELAVLYRPLPPPPPPGTKHVAWSDLFAGSVTVRSTDEINQLLAEVSAKLAAYLDGENAAVTIDNPRD